MRRWKVRMTFEGFAEGEVSHDAIQAFKRMLGLAPEAMRSEIAMTDLSAHQIVSEDDVPTPEAAEARPDDIAEHAHRETNLERGPATR